MNGINTMTGQYQNTSAWKSFRDRIRISILWTLITSLSLCGWDLIYEETYTIENAGYFFALWAINWYAAAVGLGGLPPLLTIRYSSQGFCDNYFRLAGHCLDIHTTASSFIFSGDLDSTIR